MRMSSKVRYQQETKCNVNLPHSSLLTSQGLQVEGQCGDCEPQAGEEQQQEQTEILSSITDSGTMRNTCREEHTDTYHCHQTSAPETGRETAKEAHKECEGQECKEQGDRDQEDVSFVIKEKTLNVC